MIRAGPRQGKSSMEDAATRPSLQPLEVIALCEFFGDEAECALS
jgi:hypothetical protein